MLLTASKGGEAFGLDPARDGLVVWRRQLHAPSRLGPSWGVAADDRRFYVNSPDQIPGLGIEFNVDAVAKYPPISGGNSPRLSREDGSFTNW